MPDSTGACANWRRFEAFLLQGQPFLSPDERSRAARPFTLRRGARSVAYDRLPRLHGETKYTLVKMVTLAINGITSLSVRPIRMIALMGIILFVVFMGMSIWVFATWVAGHTVQGWTSVMLLFLLIASFQTFAIAVIGETPALYRRAGNRHRSDRA